MTHSRVEPETWFLRNGHLLWLTVASLLVGGATAAWSLPRIEDPRIVHRDPLILTPMPGASAERVDAEVTEVLEQALEEVESIKRVESVSRTGISLIAVELDSSVGAQDNERLFAELRDAVDAAAADLPPEAGSPVVDDERVPAAFTSVLGITWVGAGDVPLGLLSRLGEELADRLRRIDGTELVRQYGGVEETVDVIVDRTELAELGWTTREVANVLTAADVKRPAGTLRAAGHDLPLEVRGELDAVARVAGVTMATGASGAVRRVGDVADVRRSFRTPVDALARVDGARSVLVAARIGADVQVDSWADAADAVITQFEAERGAGIRIQRVFDQAAYTSTNLRTLFDNLLAGAGVISLVIFALLGFRAALVVVGALPLVVACVLLGWQVSGHAIHQMSIFGLIIALGLLIDNAIVVTDDIAQARASGLSAREAVRKTVRHLFGPLLASTTTTVLAFAPIFLMPGSAGDFVGAIGVSVVLAVASSYVLALTVTAAWAGRLLRPRPEGTPRRAWRDGFAPAWVTHAYTRTLRGLLAAPWAALALALALPAAGFVVAGSLGSQFFPPTDRNQFEIRLWTAGGTSLEETARTVREVEATLRRMDGVEHVSWLVGGSFPSVYYNLIMNQDRNDAYANGIVTTTSSEATARLLGPAQEQLAQHHPQARIVVRRLAQGPPVQADIELRLQGGSDDARSDQAERLRVALQRHPDVVATASLTPPGEPKLFFDAEEESLALAGLTLGDVAQQLDSAFEGARGGRLLEGVTSIPVRVVDSALRRSNIETLANTPLVSPSQLWTPASSVGTWTLRPETPAITRLDGVRVHTVEAYVREGALPIDVQRDVLQQLDDRQQAPADGVVLTVGGASEADQDAKGDLAGAAPVLATLLLATLILVFRSVRLALVLLTVAGLSLGLALLSTWTMSFPISFNTLLGTLGLLGVALNDSIVVLAAIRADPDATRGDLDALVRVVVGATRHILATTLTTLGGFLPLLLFVGGDFWPSLAIVLAGGIVGATLIALLFIPAAVRLLGARSPSPIAFGT